MSRSHCNGSSLSWHWACSWGPACSGCLATCVGTQGGMIWWKLVGRRKFADDMRLWIAWDPWDSWCCPASSCRRTAGHILPVFRTMLFCQKFFLYLYSALCSRMEVLVPRSPCFLSGKFCIQTDNLPCCRNCSQCWFLAAPVFFFLQIPVVHSIFCFYSDCTFCAFLEFVRREWRLMETFHRQQDLLVSHVVGGL